MRMNLNRSGFWQGSGGRGGNRPQERPPEHQLDLRAQVEAAQREWQATEQYFQMVSDPELVDHAIYAMEAAQRKYLYLFRQLRKSKGLPEDREG